MLNIRLSAGSHHSGPLTQGRLETVSPVIVLAYLRGYTAGRPNKNLTTGVRWVAARAAKEFEVGGARGHFGMCGRRVQPYG